MNFSGSKKDAAQYASDTVQSLKTNSLLTMIIHQDSSGVCSVSTATNMSSEDIEKMLGRACLEQLMSTL